MKLRRVFAHGVIVLIAGQALAGCGESASRIAPPLITQQRSETSALLYVSEPAANDVLVYSYPGLRLKGKLTGLSRPEGLCVDEGTGNVWIVEAAFADKIVEYAHGGIKPIRTLKADAATFLQSCAVDPGTGNLAVVNSVTGDDPGSLLMYRNAHGSPTSYSSRKLFFYDFAGYDAKGNVFVDAGGGRSFRLAELPAGGTKLILVPLKAPKVRFPGGVQYDGANLAIGDEKKGVIYQISGGTVVGTTRLQGACFVQQFFIDGGQVIAPNYCGSHGELLIYNYPAGGAPIKKVTGLSYPFGAVVSR
jgi:hypothetical protein